MSTFREATAVDAPAIARIHVESWQATYRGIVPDDTLANLSIERRASFWAQILDDPESAAFAYVAEDATCQIIGFASGCPEREHDSQYTGELSAIYVRADQHGKGIGSRLVGKVAERLASAGLNAMLVWVLADNPYRRFYAALGGVAVREKTVTIGGTPLTEVAYGWADTRALRRNGKER